MNDQLVVSRFLFDKNINYFNGKFKQFYFNTEQRVQAT